MLIFSLILIQIIIFGGLILLFKKIMTQNVISATRHIEELSDDYASKEKEVDRQLEDVRYKSEEALKKAQEDAEKTKEQIIKEAETERDRIIKLAHEQSEELMQQADKSRQLLLAEMNERIARDAVDKACELIQDTLPEQFKLEVHQHWMEELMDSGFDQFERLRVPDGVKEVNIISAFPLNDSQRKSLTKKLKEALGREISLKEKVEPRIVAGFTIGIGSLVLDGSLKNKIQEKARNA